MAPGLRLARGLGFRLSHLLRAVLTNSNEKKDPIPQRNFLGFTNLWCASLPRAAYEFNKPLTSRRLPRFQSHSGASGRDQLTHFDTKSFRAGPADSRQIDCIIEPRGDGKAGPRGMIICGLEYDQKWTVLRNGCPLFGAWRSSNVGMPLGVILGEVIELD